LEQKIELTKEYQFDPPFTLGYNTVMSYLTLKMVNGYRLMSVRPNAGRCGKTSLGGRRN
jgi:hypothetical protein